MASKHIQGSKIIKSRKKHKHKERSKHSHSSLTSAQDHTINALIFPMHDLPFTYLVTPMASMRGHVNVCSCHQNKENTKQTLTLTCDSKPSN